MKLYRTVILKSKTPNYPHKLLLLRTQILPTILILVCTILILSCSKENARPIDNQKIILIQKHTWILDSTNTITDSYNVTQVEIPASTYNFYKDSMIVNFHNTNLIYYGLFYEAPDKIYFWLPGEMKNQDEYIVINIIQSTVLVASEIDKLSNRTRKRYFHAQ